MLELGEVLKTWALAGPPDGRETAAEVLPDHRRQYLEYEGPLSGNRGQVSRWDAGQYVLESQTANRWVASLSGQRLSGRIVLSRQSADSARWKYKREA